MSLFKTFDHYNIPVGPEGTPYQYFEALRDYGTRGAGRYHVPGHKGGLGIDPEFRETLGESTLELDLPLVIPGVDVGASPTPFEEALELAADAWGARQTWFLSNGATQGSHAICVALAGLGSEVVVQRNVHASTIDGLILAAPLASGALKCEIVERPARFIWAGEQRKLPGELFAIDW